MHKFQQLLPIIFIIIWILASFQGKKRKQAPRGSGDQQAHDEVYGSPEKSGPAAGTHKYEPQLPQTRPGGIFGEIRRTLEEYSRESNPTAEQEPDIFKTTIEDGPPEPKAGPMRKTPMKVAEPGIETAKMVAAPIEIPIAGAALPSPNSHSPVSSSTGGSAHAPAPTVWQLRNAVIWREILSPPVALRENDNY